MMALWRERLRRWCDWSPLLAATVETSSASVSLLGGVPRCRTRGSLNLRASLAARQQGRGLASLTWLGWIELNGAAWSPTDDLVRGQLGMRSMSVYRCNISKVFQRAFLLPGEARQAARRFLDT